MNDAQFPPDQLVGKVGIDAPGIEQVHPVLQFLPAGLDLLQFGARMMELPLIVAPGQNAVGTQHHIAREEEKKKHRNRRPESRKKQYAEFRDMRHGPVESKGRRSEEHTSELQSLMRRSSAVFCLKQKQ